MTEAQRSYLEAMNQGPIACLDVRAGPSAKCVAALLQLGYARRVYMPDVRDETFQITKAGRRALHSNGELDGAAK